MNSIKKQYGLLGKTLGHSFSKKYFTEKFKNENIKDSSYDNFEIEHEDLIYNTLKSVENLKGFNITIPYKESIIKYLDEASEAVQKTGACNCVKIINGKWIGYNTDILGFENSILPFFNNKQVNALVLGNGGAAKAVAYVLEKNNINKSFAVRKNKTNNCFLYEEIANIWPQQFNCLINTTPLGTHPNISEKPNINFLPQYNYKDILVYDLIYNPPKTLLLQEAEAAGCTIKNGNDMLIGQAEASWEIWQSI